MSALDWLAHYTAYDGVTALWVSALGVLFLGFAKGGLGSAFALVGVPILSLVMPPLQAAAILLPLLLMMDAASLWIWRGWLDRSVLRALLPGAIAGIGLGAATAVLVSDQVVGLVVGLIALSFALREAVGWMRKRLPPPMPGLGWVFGIGAGFTSFVAHAGGPLFQVHALPLRLDPRLYTGTSVVFFAVVNAIKVIPYAALGFFEGRVLVSALVMIAPGFVGVWLGAMIVRRMPARVFYPFSYVMVAVVGGKLVWDGLAL